MKNRLLMLSTFFIPVFIGCSYSVNRPTPSPEPVPTPVERPSASGSDDAKEVLKLVNALRAEGCRCGSQRMPAAPPLEWNNELTTAAEKHAADMQTNNFFDHTGSNGSSISDRIEEEGYNWTYVGENIGWGYGNPKEAVEGWKESTGHCKNMMSTDFKHIGIAHNGAYWVQTFAAD